VLDRALEAQLETELSFRRAERSAERLRERAQRAARRRFWLAVVVLLALLAGFAYLVHGVLTSLLGLG